MFFTKVKVVYWSLRGWTSIIAILLENDLKTITLLFITIYRPAKFVNRDGPSASQWLKNDFWTWSGQEEDARSKLSLKANKWTSPLQMCKGEDGRLHANLLCAVNVTEQPGGTLPDLESTDEAVRLLKSRASDGAPFFLAVGFHKPHIPFRIPQVHESLFMAQPIQHVLCKTCNSSEWKRTSSIRLNQPTSFLMNWF